MTSLRKLERDRTAADLASVEQMLGELGAADAFTRLNLEERRDELREALQTLQGVDQHTASAALFFGGRPVVGALGIDSEFGSKAVATFQDLVAKQYAQDFGGGLGLRGVVPNKASTRLHVTDVVRGSFGFQFEELLDQPPLLGETALQAAIDHAVRLMASLSSDEDEVFQEEVANVDPRVLSAARDFFVLMRQEGATFRVVAGDNDKSFDPNAVDRAADRAQNTAIVDSEKRISGSLMGVLPQSHRFEFRSADGGVISGKVDRTISANVLSDMLLEWVEKDAVARLTVRSVLKGGHPVRESFTLHGIEPPG